MLRGSCCAYELEDGLMSFWPEAAMRPPLELERRSLLEGFSCTRLKLFPSQLR
jgi:hypothetical protein